MVFVTGYGQMCNNILQFGHYYAWGKERGVKTIAMRFCYKYPFFKINNLRGYNYFTYLFAKYGAKIGLIKKVSFLEEDLVTPANLDLLVHSNYILAEGWYLRDYEAFLRCREEIKEYFTFKKQIIRKVDAILPVRSKITVCLGVHMRRGDYTGWKDGQYFFSDEDYIAVIQSFLKNMDQKEVQIMIVSNDRSLQLEKIQQKLQKEVFWMNGNAGEDLYALSTCNYIIGPPSTFSLMAAFYNDIPLYWILDKTKEVDQNSFQSFNYLFRQII